MNANEGQTFPEHLINKFQVFVTDRNEVFSVADAWMLVKELDLAPQMMLLEGMAPNFNHAIDDPSYALRTSLDYPLLALEREAQGSAHFCQVIDGWHRAYRVHVEWIASMRKHDTFPAYVIPAEHIHRVQVKDTISYMFSVMEPTHRLFPCMTRQAQSYGVTLEQAREALGYLRDKDHASFTILLEKCPALEKFMRGES